MAGTIERGGSRGEAAARLHILVLQQLCLVLLATPYAPHLMKMSATRLVRRNELAMS